MRVVRKGQRTDLKAPWIVPRASHGATADTSTPEAAEAAEADEIELEIDELHTAIDKDVMLPAVNDGLSALRLVLGQTPPFDPPYLAPLEPHSMQGIFDSPQDMIDVHVDRVPVDIDVAVSEYDNLKLLGPVGEAGDAGELAANFLRSDFLSEEPHELPVHKVSPDLSHCHRRIQPLVPPPPPADAVLRKNPFSDPVGHFHHVNQHPPQPSYIPYSDSDTECRTCASRSRERNDSSRWRAPAPEDRVSENFPVQNGGISSVGRRPKPVVPVLVSTESHQREYHDSTSARSTHLC